MKNLIDNYFKLQDEIFKHCGYQEGWKIYPIVDYREYFWTIDDEDLITSNENDFSDDGNCYCDEIIGNIFKGEKYTLILVDTHVDGNSYLALLNNLKEVN